MKEQLTTVLETLKEVRGKCEKRSNRKMIDKAIKYLVLLLVLVEAGEKV